MNLFCDKKKKDYLTFSFWNNQLHADLIYLRCLITIVFRLYMYSHKASKDDITVYAALSKHPPSQYVNVSRWYNHIETLLGISYVPPHMGDIGLPLN